MTLVPALFAECGTRYSPQSRPGAQVASRHNESSIAIFPTNSIIHEREVRAKHKPLMGWPVLFV
jgi:hypothetical protein